MTEEQLLTLIKWLLSDDTGISSKQIAAVIVGFDPSDTWHYPSDPGDLGRCLRLLELFPDFDIRRMKDVNEEWDRLSNNWERIAVLYRIEKSSGQCPKTYDLMKLTIGD